MVPDTVTGALILSFIDFILSFFMIAGIGIVLSWFPILNRYFKVDEAKLRKGHP
ncbi:MAG: hypothetical protein HQL74_04110 [Magnetococcales bacterium]|nr:hypothetical protein [Magnetococcales bacterium]